jgi:hypothetical protein
MDQRADRLRRDIRFFRRIVDRTLDQGDETVFEAAADLLKERRDDLDSLQQPVVDEKARGNSPS